MKCRGKNGKNRKNRKNRNSFIISMVIGMAILFTGCGSADKFSYTESAEPANMNGIKTQDWDADSGISYDASMQETAMEEDGMENTMSMEENSNLPQQGRKLIKTVNMNVETQAFDELVASVEKRVAQLGGYIEKLNTSNASYYDTYDSNRYASLTLRIPQEKLDDFVEEVASISNVTSRTEEVKDITLQYVDTESHKKSLEIEQDRLLALLERAETIEDIITLEGRMSEVRYQLECMASQLRTYDNQVDFSTVYLYINEVKELTPVEEETTWQIITRGFSNNVNKIITGCKNLMIHLIINIPIYIIWIVVIVIFVLLIKGLRKRTAKKKMQQTMQMQNVQENPSLHADAEGQSRPEEKEETNEQ